MLFIKAEILSIENTRVRRKYEQSFVRALFDSIAKSYDLLNHSLSFGIDIIWRRKAIKLLMPYKSNRILDAATGTADLAIEAVRLNPECIIGIDISPKMLEIAKTKVELHKLDKIIKFEQGEAESLNYPSEYFDIVTVAFGVRNFSNLELGLSEFYRVLRTSGLAMILEFSKPKNFIIKYIYNLYSNYLIPFFGGLISKNRPAYKYLPNTIAEFPDGDNFCDILKKVGFKKAIYYPQTFRIATIYLAFKDTTSS